MPPAGGPAAHAAEIDLVRRWIEQGAKWQKHWAFLAPRRSAGAARQESAMPSHPDRRLRAGPARTGRADALARGRPRHAAPPRDARPDRPAADARRGRRLPRRQPPGRLRAGRRSPAGLARASASAWRSAGSTRRATPTPTATRATASASCGAGATGSSTRSTANLPFDRFTVEQLAGDLLPDATLDQLIATGFNRNHRGNAEGGIIPEEYAAEYVVDRVETTATVWLGLTHRLRPLPRPQVRPVLAEGVLPALRLLQQRPRDAARRSSSATRRRSSRSPTRAAAGAARRSSTSDSRRPRREAALAGADSCRKRCGARRTVRSTTVRPDWTVDRSPAGPATESAAPDRRGRFRDGQPAFAPGKVGEAAAFDGTALRRRRRRRARSASRPLQPRRPGSSPRRRDRGTIVSQMTDVPQGDGYAVRLRRRPGAGQPRQALARRRAPRRDRARC